MRISGRQFLQGNEAVVEAAIAAGCRFFAGYPITPASEIAETMAIRMPQEKGIFIQMEDELASLSAVIGASWAGAKAMTATSGPGFSLMQENIGMAVMTETPCVIVDVQRSGPSSGQATRAAQGDLMQAKWGSHGDYELIVIYPNSVQELYDKTIEAFNLAEKYRTPVILLSDEIIAHMRENIYIPETLDIIERKRPRPEDKEHFLPWKPDDDGIPPMAKFGDGFKVMVENNTHDATGRTNQTDAALHTQLINRLCNKILNAKKDIVKTEGLFLDDAELVVVSCGCVSRSALEAVKMARQKGIKAGYFRLITIWPFADEQLIEVAGATKKMLVAEMNTGKLLREVKRVVDPYGVQVNHLPKIGGAYHTPGEILASIEKAVNENE
ncbi:2-oxoacid:acceptor oxidoreductase subunit alpha [Desulfofundulus salinus]|uniref:2-oxoacid:acceptor oxidoreductase subunit alpha n=1 Tax=Desulfofundulus salinus TaxID=2419843 RepID=A0A494X3U1_9FIRM|nr:2-oxoacid:acceptor oxidoreductase subunit alpha [Desulfofundulus salinum]RKO67524.1 2-oxoacid:acceptor oxidoreductase subunit alpha [Desulfofundulus salinum]